MICYFSSANAFLIGTVITQYVLKDSLFLHLEFHCKDNVIANVSKDLLSLQSSAEFSPTLVNKCDRRNLKLFASMV